MTFARRLTERREQREAERERNLQALCTPSRALTKGSYAGGVSGQAVDKDEPLRSESYRRLVAALPCKHCQRTGCQAAHPNAGKGMAMKADDRGCFPLCPDCHRQFDQGAMFSKDVRRVMELIWGKQTRQDIKDSGSWPKGLPLVEEEQTEG